MGLGSAQGGGGGGGLIQRRRQPTLFRRSASMLGLAHRLEHPRRKKADRVDAHGVLLDLALDLFIVTLHRLGHRGARRSEEHTSELQSLMRISYAVFCLKKKKKQTTKHE